ncbi:MAG: UdgX family uracil-DNA binding protein [Betaproteobacteria bacterium]|nr:MAG: UdgX family uracil-DNA binding protein [Betaproteobacteria bacterium]
MQLHIHHAIPDVPRDDGSPATCRRCGLWKGATQAVIGEGPRRARLMLVGEAPGDDEDKAGHPFVGPAGKLLRDLLREVGVDPATVFITNAVKHFGFEMRGRRRMHKSPGQREIEACNIWLRREIGEVGPKVIVTLGTTALRAILGERVAIVAARERTLVDPDGIPVVATYHPSALLRAPAQEDKETLRRAVLADLTRALRLAGK